MLNEPDFEAEQKVLSEARYRHNRDAELGGPCYSRFEATLKDHLVLRAAMGRSRKADRRTVGRQDQWPYTDEIPF